MAMCLRTISVLAQLVFASSLEQNALVYNVKCSTTRGEPSCSVHRGEDASAEASGTWQDDIEKIGWGRLLVKTSSSEPGIHAFAAGYLEGYLTAGRIAQHLNNTYFGAKLDQASQGVFEFLQSSDAWWRHSIKAASATDAYWRRMAFISDQLDGLVAGVNAGVGNAQRQYSRLDMFTLNSLFDLDDVKQAVDASQRAVFESMEPEQLVAWTRAHGHCSSVIKLLPDGSELYAGHNTWVAYYNMLRVFKRYEFGSSTPISMSSYPGIMSSSDDFYQVGQLVVMETTLPNYNNDLFELIKPESLLFWIRAMTANYLASSGPEWMEIFQKHNSGTYNNMWMVVDYSKFRPREPVREGLLTVGEQVPGHFHYEDQTRTLSYGYFPSYNAALYPETARRIKQDIMQQTKGNKFSYQMVERAQIFRRDQTSIKSDEDMQRVMRYNKFETDPIANGDSCAQLSCRSDLAVVPSARAAFGAIDAKYTSSSHNRQGQAVVVSGPTHDDQPVFDWAQAESFAATPHDGQPRRFEFGWMIMGPDASARPFASSIAKSGAWSAVMLASALLAVVTFVASAVGIRRWRAGKTQRSFVPDASYKNLQSSPVKSTASTMYPSNFASPLMMPTPSP